ncbi:hypothetical protein PRIPAC_88870 [Pristionchus pacificus]|uniref:Uncharacterized protein n=1 Tax=Pristionchus pacificus TaxID=54126 RepID=A0A2A6B6W4_PRIPA|nr:hypothetical protein PRIPAC_88870 [Pristionchus pacificus]|eukprot:PDM61608.1 hypothetical protein PRIPAC_51050 [Pristionchus pacificus]
MIKCTPQVFDGEKKPAEISPTPSKKPKFKIGEMVRMSHQNKAFRRGYKSGWTDEVFHIVQALTGSPPTYRLVDKFGEEISGIVYEQEIVHAGCQSGMKSRILHQGSPKHNFTHRFVFCQNARKSSKMSTDTAQGAQPAPAAAWRDGARRAF